MRTTLLLITSGLIAALAGLLARSVTVACVVMASAILLLVLRRRARRGGVTSRPSGGLVNILLAALVVPVLAMTCGAVALGPYSSEPTGRVIDVLDGRTLDVRVLGRVERVRLADVITPLTSATGASECLGTTARSLTQAALVHDPRVVLRFEQSAVEGGGRSASVRTSDGEDLGVLLAQRGLAIPHETDLGSVEDVSAANDTARKQRVGLYDPTIGCTAAGAVQRIREHAVAGFVVVKAQGTLRQLRRAAAKARAVARWTARRSPARLSLWRLYTGSDRRAIAADLKEVTDIAAEIAARPAERQRELAAQAAARRHARAHRAALAARRQRAAERRARAADERRDSATHSSSGGLSGYTGCRAYAPGGRTWQPIPCP